VLEKAATTARAGTREGLPALFAPTPAAARRAIEFFRANASNPNTRNAYAAVGEFAARCRKTVARTPGDRASAHGGVCRAAARASWLQVTPSNNRPSSRSDSELAYRFRVGRTIASSVSSQVRAARAGTSIACTIANTTAHGSSRPVPGKRVEDAQGGHTIAEGVGRLRHRAVLRRIGE
jgi:hypothetical protein